MTSEASRGRRATGAIGLAASAAFLIVGCDLMGGGTIACQGVPGSDGGRRVELILDSAAARTRTSLEVQAVPPPRPGEFALELRAGRRTGRITGAGGGGRCHVEGRALARDDATLTIGSVSPVLVSV